MKILILGGTGLISTAITRQLLERGHNVTHFNRGQTEARIPAGTVNQIVGDRKDYPAFERQMQEAGHFDCVIDMICYTEEDAASLVRAFRGRIGQLIFCSTVDVYARPTVRFPIREDEPRGGVSAYGKAKVQCEDLLLEAHERGDFPVTVIRPAHTFGEGGRIIHSMGWSTTYLDRIRKGKPIIVHGNGQSLWVSCHIDDVGQTFANAAGNANTFGKCYHVTGEDWTTWDHYTYSVAEALGAPEPTIVHIPADLLFRVAPDRARVCLENFQFNNIFDNAAARADLGFRYRIPFVEGVRRTYAWLEARGRIENSDDDPFYDRIIAAWERLGTAMAADLAGQHS